MYNTKHVKKIEQGKENKRFGKTHINSKLYLHDTFNDISSNLDCFNQ